MKANRNYVQSSLAAVNADCITEVNYVAYFIFVTYEHTSKIIKSRHHLLTIRNL